MMYHVRARLIRWLSALVLAAAVAAPAGFVLFEGDGSDEPGFVAPQRGEGRQKPPGHIASGETQCPKPPVPDTPQAHTERKKPPKPPVLFTKLTSDRGEADWNTRPRDLPQLLESMKGMMGADFGFEVRRLEEVDPDPDQNPILYRSGHFHFQFSPAAREKLRAFCLNGGVLILNTGMGSKPFYDSARAELAAVFPETPLQRLAPDHPILHAYYDLDRVDYCRGVRAAGYTGQDPWLEGVTVECRTVAVLSRWGMEMGWEGIGDDDLQAYAPESARKLGVNLMAYAVAERAWVKSMARSVQYVDKQEVLPGVVSVAQVMYDGEWKTRHAGLSMLLQQFNRRTGVPVKFSRKELRLSDAAVFDAPLLYITGHDDFRLAEPERANLREYLRKGGVLFAEACCGRRGFDQAFRRELAQVLPDAPLRDLPADSPAYAVPNRLAVATVTPALAAALRGQAGTTGSNQMAPKLFGAQLAGHCAVVYSPYALAGGWEMSQCPYALGYENTDALRLGENILMYTVMP